MSIIAYNLQSGYSAGRKKIKKIGPPISLQASNGELVALIGANGIGKSTLLRTIAGLQKPLSGTAHIENKALSKIGGKEIASLVSFVSTENINASYLSVQDLVALGRFPYTNWLGNLTSEDNAAINNAISLMHLENLTKNPITEISDGERQRAMIARAIAQNTPIIILDEPTAFLDLKNKHEIVHLLGDLAHKENKTVIFSTHDLTIALSEADKIWLLEPECAMQAAPEDFLLSNRFDKLFGNDIIFDPKTLSVRRKNSNIRYVSLVAEKNSLKTFTEKALNRIGFAIEENSQVKINAIYSNNAPIWHVVNANGITTYTSLYDLCLGIK